MPTPTFSVRPLTPPDLAAVGRLAGALVRYHHALDAGRFLLVDRVEEGYARFFAAELEDPRAVLLVATDAEGAIVGYAYGRFEGRDWNLLLDEHGALHDVLVTEAARGAGVGEELVRETCRRLEALGAPRVLLSTAVQNTTAQALFEKVGFKKTMIEMTRERGAG